MGRAYLAQVETTDPKGWHTVNYEADEPQDAGRVACHAFEQHATPAQMATFRAGADVTVRVAETNPENLHPNGAPKRVEAITFHRATPAERG